MKKGNGSQGQFSNEDVQTLEMGRMVAEAFQNPIFQTVYQLLSNQYYTAWVNAEEPHTKEMGSLKSRHMALNDVYQTMAGLKARAELILEEREKQNSPEAQAQAAMDTQGFGIDYSGRAQ